MLLLLKVFGRKDKYDRQVENCTEQPGIVYDFSMKNWVTFEDKFKYKEDLPLTSYIDFETTAQTPILVLTLKAKICLLFFML